MKSSYWIANALLFSFFVILVIGISSHLVKETFEVQSISTRTKCPTRNSSYDIRGEEYYPPHYDYLMSSSDLGPSDTNYCSKGLVSKDL